MHTVSAQESRNVIGVSGLEKLPKYGEIILISPNYGGPVHGEPPVYTPDEINDRIKIYRDYNRR